MLFCTQAVHLFASDSLAGRREQHGLNWHVRLRIDDESRVALAPRVVVFWSLSSFVVLPTIPEKTDSATAARVRQAVTIAKNGK
jgi:hypothetical protein